MKLSLLGLCMAGAASAMAATEITFTGADASNPTNLASAANWSAAPGADKIGVIDLSQTSARGYEVASSLALSGLKVKGIGATPVTFGGDGTLTLGADGYTSVGATAAKGNVRFYCPLALAADQTWDFCAACCTTRNTVSGTAALTISNFYETYHEVAPAFGGTISYRNCTRTDIAGIFYRGAGKWAKDVYVYSSFAEIKTSAPIAWRTIFPEGDLHVPSRIRGELYCSKVNDLTCPLVFNEGDAHSCGSAYTMQIVGPVEQRGGTVAFNDSYYLTLGSDQATSQWRSGVDNIRYLMTGGALSGGTIEVGFGYCGQPSDCCRFEMRGGTVRLGLDSNVDGGVILAAGDSGKPYSVVECLVGGGSMTVVNGAGNSPSIGFCAPNGTIYGELPAALFTQTGGVVNAQRMTFGSARTRWENGGLSVNGGYARFDLSGGTMNLSNASPLLLRPKWNDKPATSNSVYNIRFHGGAFNIPNESAFKASSEFPKSDAGTVFGADNRSMAFDAPIWGTGRLVKEGTGTLLLTDATRFTGTLDVKGGTVTMKGASEAVEGADNCICWTADSLVSKFADGARVTDWTDDNFGILATTSGCRVVEKRNQRAPTFKANLYNGHAAVRFFNSALAVPQAQNPIYGRKSCTVVAVLKPDDSVNRLPDWHIYYNHAFLSVFPNSDYSTFAISAGFGGVGVIRRFWGENNPCGYPDTRLGMYSHEGCELINDGKVHAVAVTIDKDRLEITLDGGTTNTVWGAPDSVAPIGWNNSGRTDGVFEELQIGGTEIGDGSVGAYDGDILELRIYTNRIFTVAEQRAITRSLLEKYDGTMKRIAKFESCPTQAPVGTAGGFWDWTAPSPVATSASWDADTIDAADGAEIQSWPSEDGTKAATSATAGFAAPKLVKNAINGHAALRFSDTVFTGLGVAAKDSPVSSATGFTAALVWRSERKVASAAYDHTGATKGLLSSKQATDKQPDFTLSYCCGETVMAGYGNATADQSIQTSKPCRLNDGEVHISMIACDGANKKYRLMTDGVFFEGSLANASARGTFDVLIGANRKGGTTAARFFDGDIAAVKLYGSALTKDEMRALGEYWAKRYASQLLVGHLYDVKSVRAIGLGAKGVKVAAGACLSLPVSETSPFALGDGGMLSGAGTFLGTYRLASGATFDISEETPARFDTLELTGGATLKISKDTLGAHVRRLVVSGANTVVITSGADQLESRETLLTYDEAEIDANATWTVLGGQPDAGVRVDAARKRLVLRSPKGGVIIIR